VKTTSVFLGGLKGFPNVTEDPAIVRHAANQIEAQASKVSSVVRRLDMLQRVTDLREAADSLGDADAEADRQEFIKHGLEWAQARTHPITYKTFRNVGVPAADLKAAGITRSGTASGLKDNPQDNDDGHSGD
jgi:hypothetical protein